MAKCIPVIPHIVLYFYICISHLQISTDLNVTSSDLYVTSLDLRISSADFYITSADLYITCADFVHHFLRKVHICSR